MKSYVEHVIKIIEDGEWRLQELVDLADWLDGQIDEAMKDEEPT